MPVDGPVRAAFGDRRSGDLEWSGWLIGIDSGQEVHSIAHGRVAYADWLRGYGLLLILEHGDGFMSLYAHNEALMRDVGDWVAPGETIAVSGRSGGIAEPALYFELRREGEPIDPAQWIDR
nr:peptidoglycan DD-metalloendopeptidase family protein [Wenzhouxiangella sp. XN201]